MTYLQIVNKVKGLVDQHPQLAQFGYGALSDIRINQTATEKKDAYISQAVDYPYVFLVPGTHQVKQNVEEYSFDMIVMDILPVKESPIVGNPAIDPAGLPNYLRCQSDGILWIKDLLAQMVYSTDMKWDIKPTGQITTFKERFADTVAGATLKLTITVPGGLDSCSVPTLV